MTIISVIEFYNRNLWLRVSCHVAFWVVIIFSLKNDPIYVEDYRFVMITFYGFSFLLYKRKHLRKLIRWFAVLLVVASVAATILFLLPKVPGVLDRFSLPEKIFAILNFSLLVYIMPSVFILSVKLMKYEYEINYRNAALNKSKSELELAFLKSQLSPHFLFNSLNNIYSLVLKKDPSAGAVITKLTDLMEFTLKDENVTFTPLAEELSFLQGYVDLERIRHSEKVTIVFDCPPVSEAGDLMIAPFILLPFVENAFKHGVNNIIGESWVNIKTNWEDGIFYFFVKNNYEKQVSGKAGGIGMKNSGQRLKILYPGKHELKVEDHEGVFSVNLKLDLR